MWQLASSLRSYLGGSATALAASTAAVITATLLVTDTHASADVSSSEGQARGAAAAAHPHAAPSPPSTTPPAALPPPPPPLPTELLSCKAAARPPRAPVVLVACGSFNPPTVAHMRMFDLAADELGRRGFDVWGGYLSPVADSYGKAELAPAADRVAMCRLAAAERARPLTHGSLTGATSAAVPDPHPALAMVYEWEARQPGYTRTLAVLRRVEGGLRDWLAGGQAQGQGQGVAQAGELAAAAAPGQKPAAESKVAAQRPTGQTAPAPSSTAPAPVAGASGTGSGDGAPAGAPTPAPTPEAAPRAMLLCGADVLASMAVPGVWRDPDRVLAEHGVVAVAREGTDLERLLSQPGSVLYEHRDHVIVVYDRVGNATSSSAVRRELGAGRPVRYLVPEGVLSYIYARGLYGTGSAGRGGRAARNSDGGD